MENRQSTDPSYDDIARLAYDRYVARGRADGSDLEDWLAAEQEARLRHAGIPEPASVREGDTPTPATDFPGAAVDAPASTASETSRRRGRDRASRGVHA